MRRSVMRCALHKRLGASLQIPKASFIRSRYAAVASVSAASSLSCRGTALVHHAAFYATGVPPVSSSSSPAAGHDEGEGQIEHVHAPSLREALPPSAVELPETTFLKCIDKEIMDEKYRLDKEEGAPPVPAGWTMHHTEGTSFIYGRRVWVPPPPAAAAAASSTSTVSDTAAGPDSADGTSAGGDDGQRKGSGSGRNTAPVPRAVEKHFLRLQLTTRDASLDPECDVRGEHFPFSFFVQRVRPEEGDGQSHAASSQSSSSSFGGADIALDGDAFDEHTFYHNSIEVRCDVVEGELVVDNVLYHGAPQVDTAAAAAATTPSSSSSSSSTPVPGDPARPFLANPFGGYPGPSLDETEEEVLDGLQSWLAERGVDDQLGEFMGQYAIWVEQAEYEMWLQQLRDYVAA